MPGNRRRKDVLDRWSCHEDARSARSVRLAASFVCLLWLAPLGAEASPMAPPGQYFDQFPDSVYVQATCGNFSNLMINGDHLSGNGCRIQLGNTSWGDGEASSFEREPDDDFAKHGELTPAARSVLAANQPYGAYEIELKMAAGSRLGSAPSFLEVEHKNKEGHVVKIELEIDLDHSARGLLFASAAEGIDPLFQDPQIGVWDLFVFTESPDAADAGGKEEDGIFGIGVEIEFAWAMDGEVLDEFAEFYDAELSAEGIVVPHQLVPEPSSALLLALGLIGLRARRHH